LFHDYFHPYLNHRGFALGKQDKIPEAIADLIKAIELGPKYADAYFNRGESYKALDKNIEAEADFAKAKELR
jgi:tetratricopeptide (TPR) repeat protein